MHFSADPTGADPFWIKYCRLALDEGRKCTEDLECQADLRCNTLEVPSPRCRKLFSLPLGHVAKHPYLCVSGWTNLNNVCTYPAKSKRVGASCESDGDCITTDPTGKTGRCYCKDWWDQGTSKYCLPVAGDFDNAMEKIRDWEFFKSQKCGSFWSEDECLSEFGSEARDLLYAIECEVQEVSRGPYLPPASCNIGEGDAGQYVDYCSKLPGGAAVMKGKGGAEGLNSASRRIGGIMLSGVLLLVAGVIGSGLGRI